jgi:RNA polymerase sigma-70 factor (ECF subfamily)
MEMDDQQLIADYISGDDAAFSILVKRHMQSIYNFSMRIAGNPQNAEDITQETFLKVWRNIKKYRPEQSFRSWIFTIAHNTAIDFLRKKKQLVFSDFENEEGNNMLEDTLQDPALLPDELAARAQDQQLLAGLVAQLSPIYQEVLLLYYNEQLTFDEIGRILGKPLDTVKSQHRRALLALRKLLESAPKYYMRPYKYI